MQFEIDDVILDEMLEARPSNTGRAENLAQFRSLFTPQALITGAHLVGRNILVTHEVIVDGWMYDVEMYGEDLTFHLMEWGGNNVRCRATLSNDPNAHLGLHLELIDASTEADFADAVEEFLESPDGRRCRRIGKRIGWTTTDAGETKADFPDEIRWSGLATWVGLPEVTDLSRPEGVLKRS